MLPNYARLAALTIATVLLLATACVAAGALQPESHSINLETTQKVQAGVSLGAVTLETCG